MPTGILPTLAQHQRPVHVWMLNEWQAGEEMDERKRWGFTAINNRHWFNVELITPQHAKHSPWLAGFLNQWSLVKPKPPEG